MVGYVTGAVEKIPGREIPCLNDGVVTWRKMKMRKEAVGRFDLGGKVSDDLFSPQPGAPGAGFG